MTRQFDKPIYYMPIDEIAAALDVKRLTAPMYVDLRKKVANWLAQFGETDLQVIRHIGEDNQMNFVDYQLTPEQMDEAEQWMPIDGPEVLETVNGLAKDGYRLTVTNDVKNSCIIVAIIGKTNECVNRGFCLSTRHGTVRQALRLALYKHFVVFEGGSWGDQGPEHQFG